MSLSASAGEKIKIGDLYYYLDEKNGTAAVTFGITDDSAKLEDFNKQYVTGEVKIPSEIRYNGQTFTVNSIGMQAFCRCSLLTGISLPETIETIETDAFWSCKGLKDIIIPESVTSIGNRAFEYCASLSSIYIPDSVTSLGNDVFYGCNSLKDISLPKELKKFNDKLPESAEKKWRGEIDDADLHLFLPLILLNGMLEEPDTSD